jgi:hypothetical protein
MVLDESVADLMSSQKTGVNSSGFLFILGFDE